MAVDDRISKALKKLGEAAEELAVSAVDLSSRRAINLRDQIGRVVDELGGLVVRLDPIEMPGVLFDPSDPRIIGRFIGVALVAQDRVPISEVRDFYGSGVYALYYDGPFEPYAPLRHSENPIYIGKADPASPAAKTPQEQMTRLSRRLRDHLRTIQKVSNTLSVEDFTCRYLVVQSGWQEAAENYLIDLFKPIWNSEIDVCYGIGKHGDAPSTRGNKRSPWDTLHPGREWAYRDPNMEDARSKQKIVIDVRDHFSSHRPYKTIDEVLRRFFEDLLQK